MYLKGAHRCVLSRKQFCWCRTCLASYVLQKKPFLNFIQIPHRPENNYVSLETINVFGLKDRQFLSLRSIDEYFRFVCAQVTERWFFLQCVNEDSGNDKRVRTRKSIRGKVSTKKCVVSYTMFGQFVFDSLLLRLHVAVLFWRRVFVSLLETFWSDLCGTKMEFLARDIGRGRLAM